MKNIVLIFLAALASCSAPGTLPDLLAAPSAPIYADGWPAYGFTGSVAGRALPSEQLFRQMGGPAAAADSVARVYLPYLVESYNEAADTYVLQCASIGADGRPVVGRWPRVGHLNLWGAERRHPVTNAHTCDVMATNNGSRFQPGGTVFYPMLLDLRSGSLQPTNLPGW